MSSIKVLSILISRNSAATMYTAIECGHRNVWGKTACVPYICSLSRIAMYIETWHSVCWRRNYKEGIERQTRGIVSLNGSSSYWYHSAEIGGRRQSASNKTEANFESQLTHFWRADGLAISALQLLRENRLCHGTVCYRSPLPWPHCDASLATISCVRFELVLLWRIHISKMSTWTTDVPIFYACEATHGV